jgi:cytochrome P450
MSAWHAALLSPPARLDPYRLYRQLRNEGPVEWSPGPGGGRSWLVGRYEDVATVLSNPSFVSDPNLAGIATVSDGGPLARLLTTTDPPEHTDLRAVVRPFFAPAVVERLRPRLQQVANRLLDAMTGNDVVDLLDDFAYPFPITVVAELLGLAPEDGELFRQWSRTIIDTDGELPPDGFELRRSTAREHVVSYFRAALRNMGVGGDGSILGELLRSGLDEAEMVGMLWLLLTDGYEAIACFIGNAALALFQHPDQHRRLCEDPSLVDSAVEELLRYDCPAAMLARFARDDVVLGGQQISRGDAITVVLGAANRDERLFEAPDDLDVGRAGAARHLSFGKGPHFCIGAALARLECQVALDGLVRRFPDLRLAVPVADLRWRDSLMLRGLRALPVALHVPARHDAPC